tara:strand:+ start:234 stop:386 length:153 start_codon:yes stop_codon:yes gene_type:complete
VIFLFLYKVHRNKKYILEAMSEADMESKIIERENKIKQLLKEIESKDITI